MIAIAKLQKAQKQRVVRSDIPAKRAELLEKVQELEKHLGLLGVVRSPYSGVVKAIKWLGQVDQKIQVEMIIVVHASD